MGQGELLYRAVYCKEIDRSIDENGLRPYEVLRRAEPEFNTLGISDKTPDKEVINAMIEHPAIIQRPIVEVGDKAVLARPIEKALELLASK